MKLQITQPLSDATIRIVLIASTNPRLNAMSADSQATMLSVLQKKYIQTTIAQVNNLADLEAVVETQPDLVILGVKLVLLDETKTYEDSPKLWLEEYLTARQIAIVGSTTTALKLEFDKQAAKQAIADAGQATARSFLSVIGNPDFEHSLNYPLFVKPLNRGDSKGIDEQSIVHNAGELHTQIHKIHNTLGSDALVEEYLPGREFSVLVMRKSNTEDLWAVPIELLSPPDKNGNIFLSESIKEADLEKTTGVPDVKLRAALEKLALASFRALGAADYGRIDMRLDADGAPNFIEANLMPGLSDHGYFFRCYTLDKKFTYARMIKELVDLGINKLSPIRQVVSGARKLKTKKITLSIEEELNSRIIAA